MTKFAIREEVGIREVFAGEATEFTPWLATAEVLRELGDALGLKLTSGRTEVRAGTKRADVVCLEVSDADRPIRVVIENQLERLDDDHLGKALIYAETLQAGICIWVATGFPSEYLAWVNAQNSTSGRPVDFYCVRFSVTRYDGSNPDPSFKLVAGPDASVLAELRTAPAPVISEPPRARIQKALPEKQSRDLIRQFLDHLKDELRRRNYRSPNHGRRPDYIRFDIGHDPARFSVVRTRDEIRVRVHLWGDGHLELYERLKDDRQAIDLEVGEGIDWPEPSRSRSSIDVRRGTFVNDLAAWSGDIEWIISKLDLFEEVFIWRLETLERGESIVRSDESGSSVA